MPWKVLIEHAGFFMNVGGVLLGGGIVWGATRQAIKELQTSDSRQNILLDKHSSEISDIRTTHITKHECEKEQSQCHRYLCRKLEELIEQTKGLHERSEHNRLGIAEIKQQIIGLEKWLDRDQQFGRNSG